MDDSIDRVRQLERDVGELRVYIAEIKIAIVETRADQLEFNRGAVESRLEMAKGYAELTRQVTALRGVFDHARWTIRIIAWVGACAVAVANLWDKIIAMLHWAR